MSLFRRAALALCLLASEPAFSEEIWGHVVGITDGDTLTLLVDQRPVKVRLAEIDAPEARQPWGTRTHQALAVMAARQEARVVVLDLDHYGRTVGRVYVGPVDVNAALVCSNQAQLVSRHWAGRESREAGIADKNDGLLLEVEVGDIKDVGVVRTPTRTDMDGDGPRTPQQTLLVTPKKESQL